MLERNDVKDSYIRVRETLRSEEPRLTSDEDVLTLASVLESEVAEEFVSDLEVITHEPCAGLSEAEENQANETSSRLARNRRALKLAAQELRQAIADRRALMQGEQWEREHREQADIGNPPEVKDVQRVIRFFTGATKVELWHLAEDTRGFEVHHLDADFAQTVANVALWYDATRNFVVLDLATKQNATTEVWDEQVKNLAGTMTQNCVRRLITECENGAQIEAADLDWALGAIDRLRSDSRDDFSPPCVSVNRKYKR